MPFKVYSRTYQAWQNMKARCKHTHRPHITKDKTRANSYCIQIKTSLGKVSTRANSLEKAIVVRDEILHRRQCVNPA